VIDREAAGQVPVLVVAGTRYRADVLARQLGAEPGSGLAVVATCRTADEALEAVEAHAPRVILLDLDLEAGGLDAIERIMATAPRPIVVAGAAAARPEAALAAGAVDVVGDLDLPPGDPGYASALARHLLLASRIRVISHPRARLKPRTSPRPTEPAARTPVVVIGASTGGPPALAQILAGLPRAFEAAVVVVQHMSDGFVEGLARWLAESCRLPVVVAADGERLRPGVVHLAPGGSNLDIVAGGRVRLLPPPAGQFNVPGIDPTMRSAADVVGPLAVGVLLTGMGRDGAAGLLALRTAGGTTIGQDEATSVVWGMPAAAQELDAVTLEMPLDAIAEGIVAAVRQGRTRRAAARSAAAGAGR
jgi:two-component system chemotaxis response regulator CheB